MKFSRVLKNIWFVAVILGLSSAYVRAFTFPFASVSPTFLVGDFMLSNHAAYDLRLPYTDKVLLKTGEPQNGDCSELNLFPESKLKAEYCKVPEY